MSSTTLPAPTGAPSWTLLRSEPLRATLEYVGMRLMKMEQLPPGDGHPVVISPGLAADRLSTKPLKNFCEQLGYTAYDWGRGFNTGPQGDVDSSGAWQPYASTQHDGAKR